MTADECRMAQGWNDQGIDRVTIAWWLDRPTADVQYDLARVHGKHHRWERFCFEIDNA